MTTLVRKLIRWFYLLFAIVAISMAVIVQAGRSFSHVLADYPQELSNYLSQRLNAKVSISSISAEWVGLKPMVDVRDLRILSQTDQPIIALGKAHMRLDLLGSFLHLRLVWSALQMTNVQMDFVQTADGFWHVQGLPKSADNPDDQPAQLDPLIDMSLLSRRIEFAQSQLNFHFVSGVTTTLNSPMLRMENLDDFHRLSLQVDIDGHPKTLTLLAEGWGDPRHKETFSSKAFVQIKHFPANEPIAATTALLLHGINAEMHSEGTLDANVWFSSRPQHEGFDVVGNLGVERLSLPIVGRKLILDSFSTELVGHWLYKGQWQLALQHIGATINQQHVEKLNVAASAESFNDPVVVHVQSLDLQRLHHALDSSGVLGEGHLRDVLAQLSPEGELRNIQVAIPTHNAADWSLQANLAQVGVNAWQGVPALRKVDGFVQATEKGGFVNIDSHQGFSMHYYPTYNAPMEYQQAKGQVAWWLQPENNQIYVNSGALEFINGDEYAKGYMWLALPWHANSGDIDLYLQIGARNLGASLYKKYTPAVVPESLLKWLAESIGTANSGFVNQVGFVYRGTLNGHSHEARSHQLFVDINHAQLRYHPEWPALAALNGRLLVSDEEVKASVDSAKLFASDVGPTEIHVFPNPDGKGSLLRVDGGVSGPAEDGLRVLRESMLHRYIGSNMDTWKLDGHMQTQVNIAVPLEAQGTGAAQQIDIDLDSSHFEMSSLKLSLQNINGHISFNQDSGLTSEGLTAILFDEPIKAVLSTKKQGDSSQTIIQAQGEVDGKALAKWSQRPEALFLKGKIPYKTVVELNHKAGDQHQTEVTPYAVVTVSSPLNGVSINLPAPYGKTADTERPLIFKMSLYDQDSLIDVSYGEKLQALFDLDPHNDNKLLNATIALGGQAKLSIEPQFLVSGQLPTLDIEPWKAVQQRYMDYIDEIDLFDGKLDRQPEPNSALVAGLPFRAHVMLDHYQVGPLALDNIDVDAQRLLDAWKVGFNNSVVTGDIYLPNESIKPLQINLQSLHLSSRALGIKPAAQFTSTDTSASSQQPAAETKANGPSIDPRSLPFASLTVRALYMDDVNYGSWSLQIRPNDKGVVFDSIHGTVKGVTVGGADDELSGAKLEWNLTESGPQTHFIGALSAMDISNVLRQWQKPDTLESSSAHFRVDTSWLGDPQDFVLKNISGNMDIWLEKGRFKSNPSAGSDGFLRLMAILNFDSLARRLRLDFSDLYKSGLAYDQISGKVNFIPGTMTFTEPLEVKTPSSRLQLAGKLDLENETINARLVATLPVAGNLTFVTAFITGLPAAAGIYVVSKLFKKQVDQATSVSYSIRGSWSDPKMSFDRLFENGEKILQNVEKQDESKTSKRTVIH